MDSGQRLAGSVFGLTLAASIPFWIIKGTKPSGDAVLWILYGVLLVSGAIWLFATVMLRRRRSIASEPLTAYEQWLQGRIRVASTIDRQRHVRGDKWWLRNMEQWDAKNALEMTLGKSRAPDLVDSYRAGPGPEQVDGVGPPHDLRAQEDYYRRRLDWLERTFKRLRKGAS